MDLNINIAVSGDWSDEPLRGLAALRQAGAQIDAQIWSAVGMAKRQGHTWEEIAEVMGLSKQAMWERYAPAVRNAEQAIRRFLDTTEIGDVVTGKVTSKTSFGYFVEVADGVEGLVHVSESPTPLDDVAVGDDVRVRLERFHFEKRRIAFSVAS